MLPLVSVAVTAELLDELLVSAYELLDVLLSYDTILIISGISRKGKTSLISCWCLLCPIGKDNS